jgi:hypothetical protein
MNAFEFCHPTFSDTQISWYFEIACPDERCHDRAKFRMRTAVYGKPVSASSTKAVSALTITLEGIASTRNCVMLRCSMTFNNLDDPSGSPPITTGSVEGDRPPSPPQVYRSKVYRDEIVNGWIVEPPRDRIQFEGKMVFTGSRAQQQALTYAYERFGNARFFPY